MLTASREWYYHTEKIRRHGSACEPRGMKIKEVLADQFVCDMNHPIVRVPGRGLNMAFMAAEAYWITSGSPLVEEIVPYCKHMAKYSDDGYIFNGAYGPMFLNQLSFVVETLKNDAYSRQAVMTIWAPNPAKTKDHRCTVSLQWLIRDGQIHCIVNMRSSDAWLGLPYDIFNFTMMTHKVRCWLGQRWEMGDLFINMGSSHLYETDNEAFIAVAPPLLNQEEIRVPVDVTWSYYTNHLLEVMHETRRMQDWG